MPPARPRNVTPHQALLAAAALACAHGVQAQGTSGLRLTPTLDIETAYSETRGRLADNGREAQARVAPGLRISGATGSVRGSLDYSGSLIYRAGRDATQGHEWQNALSAAFLVEAVPNWAFVDAKASISQQAASAFGQQTAPGSLQSNANRNEISTVSVSPYVRGSLSGWADYEVRLQAGLSDSRDPTVADSRDTSALVSLKSPSRGTVFGWALTGSQERSELDNQPDRPLENSRVNATLRINPSPEVRFALSGGRESVNDGTLAERLVTNTSSLSFEWAPSARTSLQAELGERYFGRSKRVNFSHRSARTVWTYSLLRDVQTSADARSFGRPVSLFDLFFEQAASLVPDPDQRRQFVLAQLAGLGLDPNQVLVNSASSSGFSVNYRQDLSMGWSGLRTTFTVQAFRNTQNRIVTLGGGDPVLDEPIRQSGYSSTLSYKLTPQTSVTFGGQRLMTLGNATQAGTDLKSANAGLTSQIGLRTSASLVARYTVFNSPTEPYRDTSVSASLGLRF